MPVLILGTLWVMFDPPKVRKGQKLKLLWGFFQPQFAYFCLFWHLKRPRPAGQWVRPNFFRPEGGQIIPPHHSIVKYLKNLKLIPQTTVLTYISTYFELFRDNYDDCTSTWFITLCVNVSHLMVCFNSSANFVIYLMGGEKFRRVWCETYMCKKGMSSSNGIQRYVCMYRSYVQLSLPNL